QIKEDPDYASSPYLAPVWEVMQAEGYKLLDSYAFDPVTGQQTMHKHDHHKVRKLLGVHPSTIGDLLPDRTTISRKGVVVGGRSGTVRAATQTDLDSAVARWRQRCWDDGGFLTPLKAFIRGEEL